MIRLGTDQFDMFAVMAKPLLDTAPISLDREAWDTFRPKQEAAEESGVIETLTWGKGTRSAGPNYTLELWLDGNGWRYRVGVALGNGGSWGQFSHAKWASREAAMLHAFRTQLQRTAARLQQRDEMGEHTNHGQLTNWIFALADPMLFGGINLEREFSEMLDLEKAREHRRGIALAAVHDLHKRAQAVLRQIDVDAYGSGWDGGLIQNKATAPLRNGAVVRIAHAAQWPAEWSIIGHAPGALGVGIYPREGQATNDAVQRAAEALRAALPEQVIVEDFSDGRRYYPLPKWTWDEALDS